MLASFKQGKIVLYVQGHPRVLCLILAMLSVCLLWKMPLILTFLLVLMSLFMLLLASDRGKEFKVFAFCSLGGGLFESVAVSVGVWHYAQPDMVVVPSWLFVLWGIAGLLIKRFVEKQAV
ncbi:MAG: DUF2878 family protein [Candidatus Omnitrophica bacterium]|nr:DUF2878 family protein [Candidatus Omnitrophota bacterium]MDD5670355.1 DUF2878 family protein [Candidatus Omnitrophota bacterium]